MIKDSNGTRGISGTIKLTEEEKKNLVKTMNDHSVKKAIRKNILGKHKDSKTYPYSKRSVGKCCKTKKKEKFLQFGIWTGTIIHLLLLKSYIFPAIF